MKQGFQKKSAGLRLGLLWLFCLVTLHLVAQPLAVEAELDRLQKTAFSCLTSGALDQGVEAASQALALAERAHGPESLRAAMAQELLGNLLRERKEYDQAAERYGAALAIIHRILGPDHMNAAAPTISLGRIREKQGRLAEAEDLYKQGIRLRENSPDVDELWISDDRRRLADLYVSQGRFADAEPLWRKNLAGLERRYGADHDVVVSCLEDLALSAFRSGHYAQAQPLYERLVATLARIDPQSSRQAMALLPLGVSLQRQGKWREAETCLQESLRLTSGLRGRRHPEIGRVYTRLANLRFDQGLLAEAEKLASAAVEVLRQPAAPAESLPDLAVAWSELAAIHQAQTAWQKADGELNQALDCSMRAFGRSSFPVAKCLNDLGRLIFESGDLGRAESLFLQARDISLPLVGETHGQMAALWNNLAIIAQKQGRFGVARDWYQKTLAIIARDPGKTSSLYAFYLSNLAECYQEEGRLDDALTLFQEALALYEKQGHPDRWSGQNNLGFLLLEKNELPEAARYFQLSLQELERQGRTESPHFAIALSNLGHTRLRQGDVAGALDCASRSLAMCDRVSTLVANERLVGRLRGYQQIACGHFLAALGEWRGERETFDRLVPLAFTAIENARARPFLDQLRQGSASRMAGLDEADQQREDQWRAERRQTLNALEALRLQPFPEGSAMGGVASPPGPSPSEKRPEPVGPPWVASGAVMAHLVELEKKVLVLNEQERELEASFQQKYPRYMSWRRPDPLTLEHLQKNVLRPGEALIEYWLANDRLFAFLITSDTVSLTARPLSIAGPGLPSGTGEGERQLTRRIEQLRRIVQQKMDLDLFKPVSLDLYKELVEPIIPESAWKNLTALYVVPHGSLSLVPFEMLITDDSGGTFSDLRWLFRRVPIAYVPSASVLQAIRRDEAAGRFVDDRRRPVLLFGDPIYDAEQIKAQAKTVTDRGLPQSPGDPFFDPLKLETLGFASSTAFPVFPVFPSFPTLKDFFNRPWGEASQRIAGG